MLSNIKKESYKDEYEGLRIAEISYVKYITCDDISMILLSVMLLIIKYGYHNTKSEYGKFTVSYVFIFKDSDVAFSIGPAITIREDSNDIPILDPLLKLILKQSEIYGSDEVKCIYIRIYMADKRSCETPLVSYDH